MSIFNCEELKEFIQGMSYVLYVTVRDRATGEPVDLGQYQDGVYIIQRTVKSSEDDILLELNVRDAIALPDPSQGIIAIHVEHQYTKDLPVGILYHECKLIDNLGNHGLAFSEQIRVVASNAGKWVRKEVPQINNKTNFFK